jgi:hypothetical protein
MTAFVAHFWPPHPDSVSVKKFLLFKEMEQALRCKLLILLEFFADYREQRG